MKAKPKLLYFFSPQIIVQTQTHTLLSVLERYLFPVLLILVNNMWQQTVLVVPQFAGGVLILTVAHGQRKVGVVHGGVGEKERHRHDGTELVHVTDEDEEDGDERDNERRHDRLFIWPFL